AGLATVPVVGATDGAGAAPGVTADARTFGAIPATGNTGGAATAGASAGSVAAGWIPARPANPAKPAPAGAIAGLANAANSAGFWPSQVPISATCNGQSYSSRLIRYWNAPTGLVSSSWPNCWKSSVSSRARATQNAAWPGLV